MEKRALELFSHYNREISIKVIPGHFATKHSHISHCIDMTKVKSQLNTAKAAAKILSDSFIGTPVDTIITLERMKMVGAFMAEYLSASGINARQDIAVLTPELMGDKMLLRDNFLPYVINSHVLLLTASATTGRTVHSAIEGIKYYGGSPVGAATVFGGNFGDKINMHGVIDVPVVRLFGDEAIGSYRSYLSTECPLCKNGVPVVKLFGVEDIPGYTSYAPQECPLCKKGVKVDAVVNSYGYSKII